MAIHGPNKSLAPNFNKNVQIPQHEKIMKITKITSIKMSKFAKIYQHEKFSRFNYHAPNYQRKVSTCYQNNQNYSMKMSKFDKICVNMKNSPALTKMSQIIKENYQHVAMKITQNYINKNVQIR